MARQCLHNNKIKHHQYALYALNAHTASTSQRKKKKTRIWRKKKSTIAPLILPSNLIYVNSATPRSIQTAQKSQGQCDAIFALYTAPDICGPCTKACALINTPAQPASIANLATLSGQRPIRNTETSQKKKKNQIQIQIKCISVVIRNVRLYCERRRRWPRPRHTHARPHFKYTKQTTRAACIKPHQH